uniref:C2H2-type domain-containing protein n=1 Tax=Monopterus albus TaxID=43700 RepID=A0A3Q3IBB0_MONAL
MSVRRRGFWLTTSSGTRRGTPVWTKRTQSLHRLKRNRRNSAAVRRESKPTSDQQLLSHSSAVAETQDQEGSQHGDSGSASNAEPERRHHKDTSQSNSVDNSPLSETHWDTHTGKKTVKCGICGKAFRFKCLLKKHLRIHTGERPYSCERCGKNTSPLSETHCDTLTGKKPFKCDTCGKAFRWNHHLSRHMRHHTGEKPYLCNTCGKRFTERGTLNDHLRIHTGEKPFVCNTCGKRYSEKSSFRKHMRQHMEQSCCFNPVQVISV